MITKKAKGYKNAIKPLGKLYLSISIFVAIGMGVYIGIWLKELTGISFLLYVGIFLGISAAMLNIIKEFKSLQKELKELEEDSELSVIADKKVE